MITFSIYLRLIDLVKQHLLHLIRNTSALEQKWLIRMIMKEMRFGLSETSVLSTFHPDAKDLYDVTNNLIKVSIVMSILLYSTYFLNPFHISRCVHPFKIQMFVFMKLKFLYSCHSDRC